MLISSLSELEIALKSVKNVRSTDESWLRWLSTQMDLSNQSWLLSSTRLYSMDRLTNLGVLLYCKCFLKMTTLTSCQIDVKLHYWWFSIKDFPNLSIIAFLLIYYHINPSTSTVSPLVSGSRMHSFARKTVIEHHFEFNLEL